MQVSVFLVGVWSVNPSSIPECEAVRSGKRAMRPGPPAAFAPTAAGAAARGVSRTANATVHEPTDLVGVRSLALQWKFQGDHAGLEKLATVGPVWVTPRVHVPRVRHY